MQSDALCITAVRLLALQGKRCPARDPETLRREKKKNLLGKFPKSNAAEDVTLTLSRSDEVPRGGNASAMLQTSFFFS